MNERRLAFLELLSEPKRLDLDVSGSFIGFHWLTELFPHLSLSLTLYNFGQKGGNGKNFVAIIKPAKFWFWGGKNF